MLRNKSIREIWRLINWAIRLDLRAADAMNIAMANRILIEFFTMLAFIYMLLQMLFFMK